MRRGELDSLVRWYNCKDEPPKHYYVSYEILILDETRGESSKWWHTQGIPNENGHWDVWVDGFGWSGDAGQPMYWCSLPPEPPIPYKGPICIYYNNGCCVGQKNSPQCCCEGNLEKCRYEK